MPAAPRSPVPVPEAPATLEELPLASEPRRIEPVGAMGTFSTIGATAGLCALGVATWLFWPLEEDLSAIRGEDAAGRAAPTLRALGHEAPVRDDARAEAVRAAVLPVWRAQESLLLPFLAPRGATVTASGREAVAAWAALRRAFARALAAERLAPEEYALTAKDRPAPFDPLLLPR